MCHYEPWEDDSPPTEDQAQVTDWETEIVMLEAQMARIEEAWETLIAVLEARIARVEARLDDSSPTEDHAQGTRNDANPVVAGWDSWQTRIATFEELMARVEALRAQIARVEARLDALETQKIALRVICMLFMVILAYAIWK